MPNDPGQSMTGRPLSVLAVVSATEFLQGGPKRDVLADVVAENPVMILITAPGLGLAAFDEGEVRTLLEFAENLSLVVDEFTGSEPDAEGRRAATSAPPEPRPGRLRSSVR
ncbi:hypothetical protein [Streptomyces caniferus]|uniref:hypothetical protein n=1 Tax=Streptomyces caniferus TaxID=285557 RepID=UPI0038150CF2